MIEFWITSLNGKSCKICCRGKLVFIDWLNSNIKGLRVVGTAVEAEVAAQSKKIPVSIDLVKTLENLHERGFAIRTGSSLKRNSIKDYKEEILMLANKGYSAHKIAKQLNLWRGAVARFLAKG